MICEINARTAGGTAMTQRASHLLMVAAVLSAGISFAQFKPRLESNSGAAAGKLVRIEGGAVIDEDTVRTARETATHSTDTPEWTNPPGFERDVFTFARVIFQSDPTAGPRWMLGRRLGWWVDYPDA